LSSTDVRPGDRAFVEAIAIGAIEDEDEKELIVKQFH
jgi:hypothetical protein